MDFRKCAGIPIALTIFMGSLISSAYVNAQGTQTPPPSPGDGNQNQVPGGGGVGGGSVQQGSAAQLIRQAGASESQQSTINSLQQEVLTNLPTTDPVYQLYNDASGDAEKLEQLARDLQPERAGSDVANVSTIQSATFGNISNRTASVRAGVGTGDMFVKERVWAQLMHSKATQARINDIDGFNSHTSGLTVGVDGEWNANWVLGTALTYAQGKTNSKDTSNNTKTKSYLGSVYGSWQKGLWYADVMVSAGRSNNEGERLNALVQSDYDADQYALRLGVGHILWLESHNIGIQPSLTFNYGRVDIESYQEEGSAALEIEAQRYEVIEMGVGVKATKSFELNNGIVDFSLYMNGWHDFAEDQVKTDSRFVTGSTIITTTGADPESTTWQAGLGVEHQVTNQLVLSINHDRLEKKNFKAHTTLAKVRYDF